MVRIYKKICKKCGKLFEAKGPTSSLCGKCYDLTGQKIGMWEVLERAPDHGGRDYWKCRCECGTEKDVNGDNLRRWKSISCGCVSVERLKAYHKENDPDLTGMIFGELKVIKPCGFDKNGQRLWECECSCRKRVNATTSNLKRGNTVSCGHKRKTHAAGIADCGTNPPSIASKKISARNTSGVKGVWYDKTRDKWTAEIMFQRKKYFLGRFADKADAIQARKEAEENLHGKFLEWYRENSQG